MSDLVIQSTDLPDVLREFRLAITPPEHRLSDVDAFFFNVSEGLFRLAHHIHTQGCQVIRIKLDPPTYTETTKGKGKQGAIGDITYERAGHHSKVSVWPECPAHFSFFGKNKGIVWIRQDGNGMGVNFDIHDPKNPLKWTPDRDPDGKDFPHACAYVEHLIGFKERAAASRPVFAGFVVQVPTRLHRD